MKEEVDRISAAFERYPRLLEPVYGLFSGGYDSLAACLVAEQHPRFAGVVHIRTGTGIDESYEYVIQTAQRRGWKLRVYSPTDRNSYESLVRQFGMPGPGFHSIPYRRLKERQLEALTRDLKSGHPRNANVLLVSGVRSQESQRRTLKTEEFSKVSGRVFVGAIYDWTKADVLAAITSAGVPESEVVATIHKSGECLCGAFGSQDELEDLAIWWPRAAQKLYDWQKLAHRLGRHWKWGTRPSAIPREQMALWSSEDAPPPGPLCSDCQVAV